VSLAGPYDAIVAPGHQQRQERDAACRGAARRHADLDVSKIVAPDTFERPVYAGNAIQTVKSKDAKKVLTIRTSTFAAAGEGGSAPVENATAAGRSRHLVLRR